MMKKIFQTIVYKGTYSIVYAVSLMPMTFLNAMAAFAFYVLYYIIGYRKAIVIQNIARSFPDKRYEEINAIVRKFYVCFTSYFAEIIKNISAPAEVLNRKVVFENLEIIDKNLKAGKNVIACMGHCGNWEILNFMPFKLEYEMYAVYKPLHSQVINKLMVHIRSRFGMKLLSDKKIVRHFLNQKSTPSVYLFLGDQSPRIKEDKYKFRFLNQETQFFPGVDKLAHMSDSAIIFLHITQLSKGNYKIKCIPICQEIESMAEGEITKKYIDLLTENIREEPYGWLWSHKRWKR